MARRVVSRLYLAPADLVLAAACYGWAAWTQSGLDPRCFLFEGGFWNAIPAALLLAAAAWYREVRRRGRPATYLEMALDLQWAAGWVFLAQAGMHLLHSPAACPLRAMLAGSLLALPLLFCSRLLAGGARRSHRFSVIGYIASPARAAARDGEIPGGDSLPPSLVAHLAELTEPGEPLPKRSRQVGSLLLAAPLLLAAAALGAAHPGPAEIE